MATQIEIIILRPTDVPMMRGMLGTFAKAFEDPETYLAKQATDSYLSELLRREHFIAICAITGTAVVGGLAAYQLDKFEQERREIYIYDLAVDAEFRRRGIATAMINTLRDEAVRRDAYVIFVQADLVDAPAIREARCQGNRASFRYYANKANDSDLTCWICPLRVKRAQVSRTQCSISHRGRC